ncbi:hypothetical protein [Paenibacillus sp. L3-i20]|uniref:hypothetical protein n=1 Tax=Paenibacillus sp. L3-i20 TaxID=2905833 RepID=UPI001EDD5530|nr:hypothetical protein [Paenibacillus sp. L3-i20]GKU76560.1 hypothetical protein L3i20_v209570 [Paenibacillus sp. L3-i20]
MNRYVLHIVLAIFIIVMSILTLWYGLWDAKQPKTGPVGNGYTPPTFIDLLPHCITFLTGIINLPVAIHRYSKFKRTKGNGEINK